MKKARMRRRVWTIAIAGGGDGLGRHRDGSCDVGLSASFARDGRYPRLAMAKRGGSMIYAGGRGVVKVPEWQMMKVRIEKLLFRLRLAPGESNASRRAWPCCF